MERLTVESKLFHRICFKCCACDIQLKTSTYEYDRNKGLFYCSKDFKERNKGTVRQEPIRSRESICCKTSLPINNISTTHLSPPNQEPGRITPQDNQQISAKSSPPKPRNREPVKQITPPKGIEIANTTNDDTKGVEIPSIRNNPFKRNEQFVGKVIRPQSSTVDTSYKEPKVIKSQREDQKTGNLVPENRSLFTGFGQIEKKTEEKDRTKFSKSFNAKRLEFSCNEAPTLQQMQQEPVKSKQNITYKTSLPPRPSRPRPVQQIITPPKGIKYGHSSTYSTNEKSNNIKYVEIPSFANNLSKNSEQVTCKSIRPQSPTIDISWKKPKVAKSNQEGDKSERLAQEDRTPFRGFENIKKKTEENDVTKFLKPFDGYQFKKEATLHKLQLQPIKSEQLLFDKKSLPPKPAKRGISKQITPKNVIEHEFHSEADKVTLEYTNIKKDSLLDHRSENQKRKAPIPPPRPQRIEPINNNNLKPMNPCEKPKPPARPLPPQRIKSFNNNKIKSSITYYDKQLTRQEIELELNNIEIKQRDLEREGVTMEKKLRQCIDIEPENAQLQIWFEFVNQKNQFFRRENELIYMRQEMDFLQDQRHAEFEIRQLMMKSEHTRTESDRDREEELLAEILNLVTMRNNIVDRMDEDRLRENYEDKEIQRMLEKRGFSKS